MTMSLFEAQIPRWFTIAAVGALLFEAAGCLLYLMDVMVDSASLPLDQRAMWAATPLWMTTARAIGVWIGLVGAIGLLLRRRWAEPLLLISFLAVLIMFSGLLIVPALRQTTPSDAYFLPIVIAVLSGAVFRLSHLARVRRWLR